MEFGNVYSALDPERKLTNDELIRAIRQLVAAEMEAIQMYGEVMNATNNAGARVVINSVIEEEKVHAGEFLHLLFRLDPKEEEKYNEGMKEASDLLKRAR